MEEASGALTAAEVQASQKEQQLKELPSVAPTKEEADLHKEVFDFLSGTVNIKRGTATYESRDQPFHLDKQVQFGTGHQCLI